MRASPRGLTVLAAAALAAPFATPALADGEQTPPATQPIAAACAGVPDDYAPFADVDGNQFEEAVLCLGYAKVTRGGAGGAPANRYVPQAVVNRDAMASFVVRLMDTADRLDTGSEVRALPAYDGTPSFADIAGNTHEATISRLADAGIVKGGSGGAASTRYVPTGTVTRGQMASFLDRALEYLLGEQVSTADDYYTDDTGDVHEQSINDISSLGIASGRAPDTYAPRDLVDRDNMAAFLARTLGELEQRDATRPLPAPAPDDITVVEQADVARNAVTNPDSAAGDDRTYTVTGLAPGEEYRVTLVEAGTLSEAGGETVFTEDGTTGLAAVGTRTADITQVNGAPAVNNTGDGTTRTRIDSTNGGSAIGDATGAGTLSVVVDLDAAAEAVVPVVYRNGGPVNASADGGRSPRLELADDGTAAEAVDTGGVFGEDVAVTPDEELARPALANADNGLPVDDRTYEVSGLVPGEEYRVTLVQASTTQQRTDGETSFTVDGSSGLAAVGTARSADLVEVDGGAPVNNTGDGTARTDNDLTSSGTAVFTAGDDGTASFVVDLDEGGEAVLPVVYRNGGAGRPLADGGASPRLELGADGVPVEVYDVGGVFRSS